MSRFLYSTPHQKPYSIHNASRVPILQSFSNNVNNANVQAFLWPSYPIANIGHTSQSNAMSNPQGLKGTNTAIRPYLGLRGSKPNSEGNSPAATPHFLSFPSLRIAQ